MSKQFTPGPWDFVESRTLIHVETRIDNPVGAGIHVCSLPKTAVANAHLIAAAPDLLAALKMTQFGFNHRRCVACAGWGMSPNGETDMVHTKTCPVALALAKAEGRTL